jgi:nucleoside transporter
VPEQTPIASRTPGLLRLRLALLLFGEYAIWGLCFVSLSSWLGASLHFSGTQIGAIFGSRALAGLVAPLIGGVIADRFAHTERMLAVLHGIGGVLLLIASQQTTFTTLYPVMVAYAFCYVPTLALAPSLALRHLAQPAAEFPVLRAGGTFGWVVAGFAVGMLSLEITATPTLLAGVLSLAFAAYCLTLPATPPLQKDAPRSWTALLGLDAVTLMRDPVFALFLLANVVLCIPNQFYSAFGALYLTDLHVPHAASLITLGQVTEMLVLLVLPRLLRRLGMRGVLLLGAGAWVLRSVLFAWGATLGVGIIVAGILLHGLSYGCSYVGGQLVMDERAPRELRAGAQGLWAVATMGIGNLAGSWAAGHTVEHYAASATVHEWQSIWLVSAAVSAAVIVGIVITLRATDPAQHPPRASR